MNNIYIGLGTLTIWFATMFYYVEIGCIECFIPAFTIYFVFWLFADIFWDRVSGKEVKG